MQRLVDFKMSRIGKLPVEIPSGVNVSLENDIVSVKGPKGELLQKISPLVKVNIEEKSVSVSQAEQSDAKAIRHNPFAYCQYGAGCDREFFQRSSY